MVLLRFIPLFNQFPFVHFPDGPRLYAFAVHPESTIASTHSPLIATFCSWRHFEQLQPKLLFLLSFRYDFIFFFACFHCLPYDYLRNAMNRPTKIRVFFWLSLALYFAHCSLGPLLLFYSLKRMHFTVGFCCLLSCCQTFFSQPKSAGIRMNSIATKKYFFPSIIRFLTAVHYFIILSFGCQ